MTDNVKNLPGPVVDLDLDEEVESSEPTKEPFTFRIKGRVITMTDPETLDWRDLALMTDPLQFVRLAMSDEDRKWFFQQDGIDGTKFGKIMEGFQVHYGLDKKMAEQRRLQALNGN